jgi:hypothetical protein
MHHPHGVRCASLSLSILVFALTVSAPELCVAQASPFMTGASALQTKGRTLLAAAMRLHEAFPQARITAFALLRTLGFKDHLPGLLEPCVGRIGWRAGDTHRNP